MPELETELCENLITCSAGAERLFQGDARADDHQRRARAAELAGDERRAGIDRVEADVEAEREMRLREPARAAAVVDRAERFGVGAESFLPLGNDGPVRDPDAAAQVAPPVAVPEVERELRRERREAFLRRPQDPA